jgi:hypothetical protein
MMATQAVLKNYPVEMTMIRGLIIGVAVILGLGVSGCFMPGRSYSGPVDSDRPETRRLADGLRASVYELSETIGERHIDRPERMNAAVHYIQTRLSQAGYSVWRQAYPCTPTCHQQAGCRKEMVVNLIAEVEGTSSDEILVVGAHYDTALHTPGADDNASGVACGLALAERLAGSHPQRTIRFVFFANEEPPFFQTQEMGSWVYAKRCRELDEAVVWMVSLEMVGYFSDQPKSQHYPFPFNWLYPSTGNFIGFISNFDSADSVRKTIGLFRKSCRFPSEGALIPKWIEEGGHSDQWSFWQFGYPGMMITDTSFFRYAYYHNQADTHEKLDYGRMAVVTEGLEKVIAELVGCQTLPN